MSKDLDIRVYPINEPKGNTLAFANVSVGDLAAIRGIRVMNSEKGMFVTMPQSESKSGVYHDTAFPITSDLRKEINAEVLAEYERQSSLAPDDRGYEKPEAVTSGRSADDIQLDVKVFPLAEVKGSTLAFASATLDETVAIRGIRIVNSEKGDFVSMPQSKDKHGDYHDIAFPLLGDVRKAVSKAILIEHEQMSTERKQGIGQRFADGKEQAARRTAPERTSAAKRAPGIGE
ncbi:SpoVG family protein [Ruminococcaceae bacterium OttesenSCG-928-L11]|nr:SpoVG family protein [Ruminococcaceae bacterium OttesenSCG-928-L11]